MDIPSPDDLAAYLMVLKEAGVVRATLGCVSVDFERAEPEERPVVSLKAAVSSLPTSQAEAVTAAQNAVTAAGPRTPYEVLFGNNAPSFVKPSQRGE